LFLLLGCGSPPASETANILYEDPPPAPLPQDAEAAPSIIPAQAIHPSHYYDERDGFVYSYIAAISEDARKAGKAAGNVVSFVYLGREDGRHVLTSIDRNGAPLSEAYCPDTCRVITYDDGSRVGYTETSIIGAAFADAIAGRLQIAPAQSSVPQPVPMVSPTLTSSTVPIASDTEQPDGPSEVPSVVDLAPEARP
jgi:hypothetical protein